MLSKEEIKRYSKQLQLPELKMSGQDKLKNARVLVVGAGGLGCPALQYLAAVGIGTIGINDFDVVDETNLQRQILFTKEDVGKSKALLAAHKISAINPFIKTEVMDMKLDSSNAVELISNYDLVVDGSDNFPTRYLINDACVLTNKTHVYGGIYKFEGQLSVFNFKDADGNFGPTYRCAFSESGDASSNLNCAVTGVIGTLPGIIGIMQANEVIKIITGIGEICSGKTYLFNALTNSSSEIKIKRNPDSMNFVPASIEDFKSKKYFSDFEEIIN